MIVQLICISQTLVTYFFLLTSGAHISRETARALGRISVAVDFLLKCQINQYSAFLKF